MKSGRVPAVSDVLWWKRANDLAVKYTRIVTQETDLQSRDSRPLCEFGDRNLASHRGLLIFSASGPCHGLPIASSFRPS